MRGKPEGRTLKQQFFVYFMLAAVFSCAVLGVYYFFSERRVLERNLQNETEQAVGYAAGQIEKAALRVEEFANQVCQDEAVRALLRRDRPEFDAQALAVVDDLDEQFQFVTITEDILSLFLVGENGLDIRGGKEAALADYGAVREAFCTPAYYPDGALTRWGVSRDNPCAFSQYPSVLPYSRRIVDAASGQTLGYLVLLLREAVFVEVCGAFLTREDEAFCLADALGQPVVCSEGWKALAASGLAAGGGTFPEQQTLGGVPYRFFRHPAPSYPWQLVEAVPMHQFAQQREILQSAAGVAVILTLALSLLLATVFSGQLARPIQRMVEAVEDIAQGNFGRELQHDSAYELRRLENGIETMQRDLKRLMDSRIAQEQEKRAAEIQMLKAQINPHFLYNTLNSIKMMAAMQGARGIQTMTEALGDILRASLGSAEDMTTLRDELKLLDRYIYIQNIRYKGSIEYEAVVREEALLSFRLQRFLLQPLLENAIIHGVACENRGGGKITLTVWREWNSLYIAVEDNGAGIPPDKLARLARGERLTSRSIGVHNVDQRLRMTYGEAYGLRFESRPGEFTRVTARLRITEEDKHEETPHPDC